MNSKQPIMRIARPTDNLSQIADMYSTGLGFEILTDFYDHAGFDGVILGHKASNYHLEFTHHRGTTVGKAPTADNLLAFYVEDRDEWEKRCVQAESSGFIPVKSYNPYWDELGKTYEDLDGYRIVFHNSIWDL
ncbi:glyoxalase [Gammaproteobacteria bacterium 45_16_T64]|nr:glyoxalase [Gammaproteobacteria bacterium 45_16_T64]